MEYELVSVLPFRCKWRAEFCIKEQGRRIQRKRIRKVIEARSEIEARAKAEALAHEMTAAAPKSMSDLMRAYSYALSERDVAPETKAGYQKAARRVINHLGQHSAQCEDFSATDAQRYVHERLTSGASSNTVRQEISVIRMALRERGLPDPFEGTPLPPRAKCEFDRSQIERAKALLQRIEGPMGLAAWLAYGCRLRTGEIAALHTDDAPYDDDTLSIRHTVGQDGVIRPLKLQRQIGLKGETLRRLRLHMVACLRGPGYLLGTPQSPANPQVIAHKWKAIARAAEVRASLNDLRSLGGDL